MALSYRLSTRRLGELLLERGSVTVEQLDEALHSRSDPRERLGQTLVRLGLLNEGDVVQLLAQQFSLPIANAEALSQADPQAVRLVPEHLARQACVLALRRSGDLMEVAVGDPLDVVSLDHVRAITGCTIKVWIARPSEVREAVDEFYQEIRSSEKVGEILDKLDLKSGEDTDQEVDLALLRQQVEDAPVVRLVNLMLAEAIDDRASDVHVEPSRDRIAVRFRIDGMLH
ncbi:MAG TPA: pilus assembly protein PilB, partial [Candidatus Limnocylindria bacterium]|nr:pilus assembly protein PilB [Candidatus Limnocylindria bacterium]